MAFEIIGSRMLGPYVGTSIMVWSSIIGIILLSLSAGYYIGGRWADKRPSYRLISLIIWFAAILMLISTWSKTFLLDLFMESPLSVEAISIISSLLLFSPAAILLGMVSPFAVRLKIKSVESSGAVSGYLYALSTTGSILGTFLAGFFLIPEFRITVILHILSITLIIVSVLLHLVYKNTK